MNLELSTDSQHLNSRGSTSCKTFGSTSVNTYFIALSSKTHKQEISSIPTPVKYLGNLRNSLSLQPRGHPSQAARGAGVCCSGRHTGLWFLGNIKLMAEAKREVQGIRSPLCTGNTEGFFLSSHITVGIFCFRSRRSRESTFKQERAG